MTKKERVLESSVGLKYDEEVVWDIVKKPKDKGATIRVRIRKI